VVVYGGLPYVGGNIATADTSNVTVNGITVWNGTAWGPLGTGLVGGATNFVVGGGILYVAGTFTSANGVPAGNIVMWNGTQFSTLGVNGTQLSNTVRDVTAACSAGWTGSKCSSCGPGYYGAGCTPCAANTYTAGIGSAACTACPAGSSTNSTAATSVLSCVCTAGHSGPNGGPCTGMDAARNRPADRREHVP